MKTYNTCRCCKNENMKDWLSLPPSPVANALFHQPNYEKYPLDLKYCSECGHIQLASAPDPDGVFSTYRYKSGVSNFFISHFKEYAEYVNQCFDKGKPGSVLEIGSNDGYLLEQFKNLGWEVIGVEPSEYLREDHNDRFVPVVTDFFTTKLVEEMNWQGKFDVICANNVLAHIPDTENVIEAVKMALADGGALVVECGDQEGIVNGSNLDNVYHEHIDYYSPYSFSKLLGRHGFSTVGLQGIKSHGKSFRLISQRRKYIRELDKPDVDMSLALTTITNSIAERKTKMRELINSRKFVAYGAAAKAVTALYTLELVNEDLIGVVDDNELKQNCYFPGTDLLITNPETLDKDALVVITAWNVYEDIKAKLISRGHRGEIICMQ